MAKEKGSPKTGGRKEGVSNKVTTEIRDMFKLIVENNLEGLQADMESLQPAERVKYTLDMAKFCLPTLKAIDYTGKVEISEKPNIIFKKK